MSTLLEVKGLTRRFGGLVAVDGFDLAVEEGAIAAVIGPNGAGKTTAFNVMTGLLRPNGGTIRFSDHDVTGMAAHKLVMRGVARTFQNIRLFPMMTALENVATGAHVRLNSSPWDAMLQTPSCKREELEVERSGMALLERVGLADYADVLAVELPYGSQRRLEIARALASQPRLLMLDEPAAGANNREKVVLMTLLRDIRDSGVTVLLIEHDMGVVMQLSDHIAVMDHGRKIAEGDPETIRNDEGVIEAYLGRAGAHLERVTSDRQARADAPPALELSGLAVSYGAIAAVKGIDITVREGEIVTLIGANGAGKSTTLKTIAGLLKPKAGEIRLFGELVNGVGCESMVARGVVLAPEGRQVFGRMSVYENLLIGAYQRSDQAGIDSDMADVFRLFPLLEERRDQLAGTLSGGEQQMLAIGRALMARPKVLMLDEPSMGLSPVLVQQIFEIIAQVHAEGHTILLVEQNAVMALSVADRGYVLQTGTIAMHDQADRLLDNEHVRDAYLGEQAGAA